MSTFVSSIFDKLPYSSTPPLRDFLGTPLSAIPIVGIHNSHCGYPQFTLWISTIHIVDIHNSNYDDLSCGYPHCGLNVNFAPHRHVPCVPFAAMTPLQTLSVMFYKSALNVCLLKNNPSCDYRPYISY
jgi:hypothetical protein